MEPTCQENTFVRTHPIPKAKLLMITKTTISNFKLQVFCDKGKEGAKSIWKPRENVIFKNYLYLRVLTTLKMFYTLKAETSGSTSATNTQLPKNSASCHATEKSNEEKVIQIRKEQTSKIPHPTYTKTLESPKPPGFSTLNCNHFINIISISFGLEIRTEPKSVNFGITKKKKKKFIRLFY